METFVLLWSSFLLAWRLQKQPWRIWQTLWVSGPHPDVTTASPSRGRWKLGPFCKRLTEVHVPNSEILCWLCVCVCVLFGLSHLSLSELSGTDSSSEHGMMLRNPSHCKHTLRVHVSTVGDIYCKLVLLPLYSQLQFISQVRSDPTVYVSAVLHVAQLVLYTADVQFWARSFVLKPPSVFCVCVCSGTIGSENMDNIDNRDKDFKPLTLKRSFMPPYMPTSRWDGWIPLAFCTFCKLLKQVVYLCQPDHHPWLYRQGYLC